jgi:hypothetical protein
MGQSRQGGASCRSSHVRNAPLATVGPKKAAVVKCQFRTHAPQQTTSLFDYLIGTCEQRRRHGETKRLCGLEIDRQFVLGRCLHRQVGRLFAFEDAVDVARRSPKWIGRIWPVGDQAAAGDEEAGRVDLA